MLPNPTPNQPQAPETGSGDNQLEQNRRRQQRGTGFTNIDRILNANQGAGQRMGQSIGSNLANQAGQVRQGIQQGVSTFQAGMNQGKAGALNAIQQGQSLKQQAGETPEAYATRLAQSTNDFTKQGEQLRDAAYQGPNSLQNANQLQSQASGVSELGRLAGSSPGQSQLLRSQVAQRGNYTQGQNALDQLLLGKEGQSAIQQGRQSSAGINRQAQGAVLNAQNQASATTNAILNNKAKTARELQNYLAGAGDSESGNITGFTELAKQQAQDYQKDAARIQQLLTGKDEQGNPITSISDKDKQLLQNMEQYGVENNKIYEKGNEADITNAINQMAGSLTNNFGTSRYLGNQNQAAQNLAKYLLQNDTAKSIADNTFDEDVFKGDQKNLFGENDARYKQDKGTQDELFTIADILKSSEDAAKARKEHFYNDVKPNYEKGGDLSRFSGDDLKMLNYQKYQEALNNAHNQGISGIDALMMAQAAVPGGATNPDDVRAGPEAFEALRQIHPIYGMIASGDARMAGSTDQRFNDPYLGLPWDYLPKSSDQIRSAGQKALGNMTDVKNYALNRYLKGQA
jgi:hypothetical protein